MRAKFINEKYKEESDPIEDMGIGAIHQYFTILEPPENGLGYRFVEKGPKFVKGTEPVTYIYTIEKGNVYMKHPDLFATKELRSNSRAFNKGKPNKMAMPNDLDAAKEFILKHYEFLKNKKK